MTLTRRRSLTVSLILFVLASTTHGFTTVAPRYVVQSKTERSATAGRLQMVKSRGRSRRVRIEGFDDAHIVIQAAAATSPFQKRMTDYADEELMDEAQGVEEGFQDFQDMEQQTSMELQPGERQYMKDKRTQTLDRKNSLVISLAVASSIAAGAWVTASAFTRRQMSVVNAYAQEMAFHAGDEREMLLCHKEYKRKLGPGMFREAMFKACMVEFGAKRPSNLQTLRAVKYTTQLFRFNLIQALKLMMAAARDTERSQTNVRSKIYFFGILIAKDDPKALATLEPLKKNIEKSFYEDGEEMLKVRMKNMAESALKSELEAVPDGEALESGWEELGISAERAGEIANELTEEGGLNVEFFKVRRVEKYDVTPPLTKALTGGGPTNDEESDPEAAAMLEQLQQEMKDKAEEVQDEKEPEPEGTAKSYECQVCGYKMFVAKGREFKFFGDDFKCPECGAGKNKFIEADTDI